MEDTDKQLFTVTLMRASERVVRLDAENAALRAAVAEMQRMLPVLEFLSGHEKGWAMAIEGNGVLNIDAYRQTLETALAQIEKNK